MDLFIENEFNVNIANLFFKEVEKIILDFVKNCKNQKSTEYNGGIKALMYICILLFNSGINKMVSYSTVQKRGESLQLLQTCLRPK